MASRRLSCGSSKAVLVLTLVVASAFLTSCKGSGVGHMPSTKEEVRDFKEWKTKSGELKKDMTDVGKEGSESLAG